MEPEDLNSGQQTVDNARNVAHQILERTKGFILASVREVGDGHQLEVEIAGLSKEQTKSVVDRLQVHLLGLDERVN
jgi:hypothetical protein